MAEGDVALAESVGAAMFLVDDMKPRIDIYSGDELIGSVPCPDIPPFERKFMDIITREPFNLGIKHHSVEDTFLASVVTFEIKWHEKDNGWTKQAALHCSPMFGPGDWECIPGFVYHRRPFGPRYDEESGEQRT